MTNETIDNSTQARSAEQLKTKRKPTKKAKSTKKVAATKKAEKPKAERANKRPEVIALMKRAKGATLAEITKATRCHPHSMRGLRQHRRAADRVIKERGR